MAVKRIALDVIYADETEARLPVRPIGLVAAERHYGGKDVPRLEGVLYGAWYSLPSPKPDFDAWMATLDAVEETRADIDAPLDPSAVGTSTSPGSQPAPE